MIDDTNPAIARFVSCGKRQGVALAFSTGKKKSEGYNEETMNNITPDVLVFIKLALAMALGMIIGTERVFAHKTAGMRTYALVAMGSALLVIISELVGLRGGNYVPTQIAANIVIGIGFLGTGLIILDHKRLTGITTATSIWVVAGIGMAVGFGFFNLAILGTIFTLFIFIVLWFVEKTFRKLNGFNDDENESPRHKRLSR